MDPIRVSGVVLRDGGGRVLTVRKRGTRRFMLPGGKPEPGETAEQAAVRECAEELGAGLDAGLLRLLGVFTAPAANEAGRMVEATVFEHPPVPVSEPAAEIEQLRWLAPSEPADDLAPLLAERVLPAVRDRPAIRRVTVFTGSAMGASPVYASAVADFAGAAAGSGVDVVYGGGRVGLMGRLADATLAAGGQVLGVIPQALVDGEIAHTGLTRLDVVADMHARKHRMAALGDAFVALPGGAGTLEELFEVWTWQQLGIHAKPVALLDVGGFWQPLLAALDAMTAQGFISRTFRSGLIVEEDPAALLEALTGWSPLPSKWPRRTAANLESPAR